ncbi:MAG: SPOR domain-containing protein [Proteobacteria bacterium]|nr:SPOR domain-containing protein [Pseudomonadota bacterium]
MEQTPNKPSKQTIIMWAIPIVILIVLIILLISQLMGGGDSGIEPVEPDQVTIEPTEREDEGVVIEIPTEEVEQPKPAEEVFGYTPSEDDQPQILAQDSEFADEQEKSFIMEEGDSLWKIAQRPDVLGDPRKWQTILIQNREKINYTIFSEETGQWKVMVDAGKRLVFRPKETDKNKTSFDRTRKKRYAVQLMSLDTDQLELAVDIVKFLITDGYHAYLYRTRDKIKPPSASKAQYFYRIRVGFFETGQEALNTGEEIAVRYEDKNIFPMDYWAVLPSYSELNGELIDFGIQRNKPFIIQLGQKSSRQDAIQDLKDIASIVDFSYISQKYNPEGGFLYRIRVGFFETEKEANRALSRIQGATGNRHYNARILEIRHVMETAPGQKTGQPSIKKLR